LARVVLTRTARERAAMAQTLSVQIVCLANSRKLNHRCIAGIDIEAGGWVRPIRRGPDRALSLHVRRVNGREPQLLDVLKMSLASDRPDDPCQPENRYVETGAWLRVGSLRPEQVIAYCESGGMLFHNYLDYVPWDTLVALPRAKRKSLQLVQCQKAVFYTTTNVRGKLQARATFPYGGISYDLAVTDAEAERRIKEGERLSTQCLLAVSLAGKISDERPQCYKLVAGVIEL